jgi:hypothetical protein
MAGRGLRLIGLEVNVLRRFVALAKPGREEVKTGGGPIVSVGLALLEAEGIPEAASGQSEDQDPDPLEDTASFRVHRDIVASDAEKLPGFQRSLRN